MDVCGIRFVICEIYTVGGWYVLRIMKTIWFCKQIKTRLIWFRVDSLERTIMRRVNKMYYLRRWQEFTQNTCIILNPGNKCYRNHSLRSRLRCQCFMRLWVHIASMSEDAERSSPPQEASPSKTLDRKLSVKENSKNAWHSNVSVLISVNWLLKPKKGNNFQPLPWAVE